MGLNKTDKPTRKVVARRRNAQKRRDSTVSDGGRRLEILLQPDAAKALARLMEQRQASATSVIGSLLLLAE